MPIPGILAAILAAAGTGAAKGGLQSLFSPRKKDRRFGNVLAGAGKGGLEGATAGMSNLVMRGKQPQAMPAPGSGSAPTAQATDDFGLIRALQAGALEPEDEAPRRYGSRLLRR